MGGDCCIGGNEGVAIFRINVGKEIGRRRAYCADGYHARADGLTSLAVLLGAIGVWVRYPLADPIVGVVISIAIFRIVMESGKAVFMRLLDGVDPEVIDEIRRAVNYTAGVHALVFHNVCKLERVVQSRTGRMIRPRKRDS